MPGRSLRPGLLRRRKVPPCSCSGVDVTQHEQLVAADEKQAFRSEHQARTRHQSEAVSCCVYGYSRRLLNLWAARDQRPGVRDDGVKAFEG